MSPLRKGEGGSGGGPGDVAGGGSLWKDKLLESGERLASSRRTAGRGAVQNGSSSASNKRGGREWKTCFEEIRAGKRRILRSDVARLRAEAEAARKRLEEEGGHGVVQDDDCFEISFQNGSDWIKVGEDVKDEKKGKLESDVAKKTEESDTHMEDGTEEALLNDDQLGNNSSTSERGEGEEMEAEKEMLVKSCDLEQMEDPKADEEKTAEEPDISERKAIKVAEAEKKKITEEFDSDMKKVTEESGSDKRELTEVSDTSLKQVTGEVAYGAYQYESSCAIIERNGREQIKCGDIKEVEMSGTMGLDAAKEEDTDGKEVMDYRAPEANENTNNSINKSNGIKWCEETKVDSKKVTWLDITKGKEEGKPDSKEVGEETDTNLKKVTEENDTDKAEATEETAPGADQHGKSATIIRRSCTEQMKCNNELEVEKKRTMMLDAANQRGEVDVVQKEVSDEAASGVQNGRKTITSKNNNVNRENEVEKRITRSAAAKQRKETDTEKKKVKEKDDTENNEATEEFVPGADQNGNISTIRRRSGMEQIACEEEINIEKKPIVGMNAAKHRKEATTGRKKIKMEAGSRIDAEGMEQMRPMENKLDKKRIMGLNVAKQRRETVTHKKKVMKDSVSEFAQNENGFTISKGNDPEQIGFEEIKIKNKTYIKSSKEKQKKEIETVKKKVMKSRLDKKRGRETSDSENTRKKVKSESLKCGRDRTEECSRKKLNLDSSNSPGLGPKSAVPATGQKDDLDEESVLRSIKGQGRGARSKKMDEKTHILSEGGEKKRKRGFTTGSKSISKRRIPVKREVSGKSYVVKMEPKSLSRQVARLNLKSSNGKSKVMVKQESSSIRLRKKNKGAAGEGRKEAKDKVREQIKNILLNAGWRIDLRPRKGKNYEDSVYISPRGSGYWSITKAYEVFQRKFIDTHNEKGKDASRSSSKSSKRREGLGFPFSSIPMEDLSMLKKKIGKRSKEEPKGSKKKLGDRSRSKKSKKAGSIKYLKYKDNVGETKGKVKENDTAGSGSKGIAGHAPKKLHSGRHKKRHGRCALLVRGSTQDRETGSGGYVPYVWKRTILSWLIDLGIVPANCKVKYVNQMHSEAMLEGWITRDGIKCNCCNKILAVSKFEMHAGSILSHPYQNIFVEETGVSLYQCLLDAWKKQDESEHQGFYVVDIDGDDPNDDTCGICGDGGDLICCDSCPSTFHLNCLGFQMLPPGDWHCMSCSCRFCGVFSGSDAQENGGTVPPLLACSLCEEKYHQTCAAKLDGASASSTFSWVPFCGRSCKEIFERLQRLLGVKKDLEAGFSWTLVQRFDEDSSEPACGLDQIAECNSKIAVALGVMHECFSPAIDKRSGIDLIRHVIYNCGSNFNRLNFRGFYTFILERDDEIISAASLRIHGTRLAEMPFIGTRDMYRRQGMCRRLLAGIESALCSLNIEKLVIPAVSELKETWTNVFGFQPLEVSQKQEIRSLNMVVFPDTCLLQRSLLKEDSTHQIKTAEGVDKVVPESKHHHTLEVANESSFCSLAESVPQAAIMTTVQCEHEIKQRESRNDCTLSAFDMSVESSDAPCGSKFEASDSKHLETAADDDLMLHPMAVHNEDPVVRSKFQLDSSVESETSLFCLGTKHDNDNAKIVETGISRDMLAINETSGYYIINSIETSPVVIASNLQDSCMKDAVNFPANDGNHNPKDQAANLQPNCQAFDEDSTFSNSEMVAEPLNAINPSHMTSLPEPDVHSDGGVMLGISHKTNDDAGHAEQSPCAFSEVFANHSIKKSTSLNAASESDLSSGGLKSSKKVASNLPDSSNVPNDLTSDVAHNNLKMVARDSALIVPSINGSSAFTKSGQLDTCSMIVDNAQVVPGQHSITESSQEPVCAASQLVSKPLDNGLRSTLESPNMSNVQH